MSVNGGPKVEKGIDEPFLDVENRVEGFQRVATRRKGFAPSRMHREDVRHHPWDRPKILETERFWMMVVQDVQDVLRAS